MKDDKILQISFQKSGSGSTNCRVHLPITWIRELGISEDERKIKICLDNDKIIIEKAKMD